MRGKPTTGALFAAWTALAAPCACGRERAALHDVLLVTVDTLRADHVGAYGFPERTTPEIDRLAARGALFETAIAASSLTAPSHASILTSRFAREHSIGPRNDRTRLEGAPTLAERFRAAGYATAAFVSNAVLARRIGLDRGFGRYDDELPEVERNRPAFSERSAEPTTRRAIAWLEAPRREPFFLWVHYQDPHGPYTPPAGLAERFAGASLAAPGPLPTLAGHAGPGGIPAYQALDGVAEPAAYAGRYAGEVAWTDRWIGRLVEAAERASGPRGLVLLLTADHGESLGEGGYWFQHGHATSPELARVPFVVLAPGVAPSRRRESVGHVDVMPTLLELAGLPPPEGASGISLAPLLREDRGLPDRLLFCDRPDELSAYRGDARLRVSGSVDLFADLAAGRGPAGGEPPESLLVLEALPAAPGGGPEAARVDPGMRAEVRAYLRRSVALREAPPLRPDEAARLRALGYLEGEGGAPDRPPAAAGPE
jgi:arylsulfatase